MHRQRAQTAVRLAIFFLLFPILACQHRHVGSPTNGDQPSAPVVEGTSKRLTLEAEGKKQELSISKAGGLDTSAPQRFITADEISEYTNLGLAIVDFALNGSLYRYGGLQSPNPPGCFTIAVVHDFFATGAEKYFLVSNYSNKPIDDLPNLTYCVQGTLTAASSAEAEEFLNYWNFRGFGAVLSVVDPLSRVRPKQTRTFGLGDVIYEQTGGKEVPKFVRDNEFATWTRADAPPPLPIQESRSAVNLAFAPREAEIRLVQLRARNFSKKISRAGHQEDLDFYEEVRAEIQASPPPSQGTFFSIRKVTLDGKIYLLKTERPKPHRKTQADIETWMQEKMQERARYLALDEISKAHPEMALNTPILSVLDRSQGTSFVTLTPYARELEKSQTLGSRQGEELQVALQAQLTALHQGVPFSLDGKEYTLAVFHRDVKPENFGVQKGKAILLDYGKADVVLYDPSNGTLSTLKIDEQGLAYAAPFEARTKGTIAYLDRESASEELSTLQGTALLGALADADKNAVNFALFEKKFGLSCAETLLRSKGIIPLIKDEGERVASFTADELKKHLGDVTSSQLPRKRRSLRGERRLLTWDELTNKPVDGLSKVWNA